LGVASPFRWQRFLQSMRVTLVAVALSALPTLSGAQGSPPLEPGSRVRVSVTEPGSRPFVGTLEALQDERLLLRVDEHSHPIPIGAIRRVEVSRGRRSSTRWTAIGAIAGGAAGALAGGCLANRDDYGVLCGGQNDTKYVIGGITGGLAGGALAAWLGRSERWETVPLERGESSRRDGRTRCEHRARAGEYGPIPVLDCR
jgi:hypothetical protein